MNLLIIFIVLKPTWISMDIVSKTNIEPKSVR
uniref:Uncharacterized protein n=1 Tax=Anguilla anguilla TaxID=7936 RepID=A0A0E9RXY5_ANGAN